MLNIWRMAQIRKAEDRAKINAIQKAQAQNDAKLRAKAILGI